MDFENNEYYKDGITRIIELLKDSFGESFSYFDGDPEEIGESFLPAICVSEPEGEIRGSAVGTDDIFETVVIKIIMNKKDDLGATPDKKLTEFKLRKLVKGQDPSDGSYLPTTLMYALRKNITLTDAVLDEQIKTQFDVNIRGELLTHEAWVTVTLRRRALVGSRT